MRILHLARYGSVKGGTEAYLRELCAAQRARGDEVALAWASDPDESRPEVANGFHVSFLTSPGAAPTSQEQAEVRALMQDFRPEVAHVHNAESSWLAPLLAQSVPVVSGVHDHRLDCPTGTRYWSAWSRACDVKPGAGCLAYNLAAHCGSLSANATLAPFRRWRRLHAAAVNGPLIQVFSEFMQTSLRRVGVRAPIEVTPYPAPLLPLKAATERAKNGRLTVFASGRLTKEKGFDLLLDAAQHVQAPMDLIIAGDGHHAAALRKRVLSSPHTLTWTGWLDRAALAQHYASADLVAFPSAWPEPFGIAGLEAMAAGKPVVATDAGGIREWLQPDVTGIAVAPRDARAFAAAIDRLAADPALRERMGAAATMRIAKDFTLEDHVARVHGLYEQARRKREEAA